MRRALLSLPLALEFLTVIRPRRGARYDGPTLGASLGWFPLVGLLIGGVLVLVDWAAGRLLPAPAVAALLVTVLVLLTRALHLDGLADSADGLFGGSTAERRLEIMRDSRTGSFGAAAITLALLLTFAALLSLTGPDRRGALLVTPALARCAMVLAVAAFPYARPTGLGRLYHDYARPWPVTAAAVSAVTFAAVVFGVTALPLVLTSLACALLTGSVAARRLGGLTGDVYGAIGVLCETALFLLAATSSEHGWLRPWLTE